jgi:hypothetical protein
MKIEMVNVSRRPPWPLWAMLLVLVWSTLGTALVWLGAHFHRPVQLCLIKRLTGVPCPTCGFTRGAISLLGGHIIQAWLYNPLLYLALAIFFAATAVRIITSRSIKINLTRKESCTVWILAGVLFFANWIYVILFVG